MPRSPGGVPSGLRQEAAPPRAGAGWGQVSLLEAVRRYQWTFFRVEVAYLKRLAGEGVERAP